ncbi:Hypothetical predicted protein [Olea europaea subsp. europaea]|uniref:Uncharacterized protein n=1 Tax=Olea europaea subsp. europaea TaxID=158383 RepID=A0A8S0QSX5_OLEEU|nr:Hypothetical predicted protein [Olea europaea subsp. europaea]
MSPVVDASKLFIRGILFSSLVSVEKLSATDQDDPGSGDEDKVLVQKKREGCKNDLKNKIHEEGLNIGDEDSENHRIGAFDVEVKSLTATQNGKRSKSNAEAKEKTDPMKEEEENGNGIRLSIDESNKSKGFRPNGNRQKNIPHRAAEACVECI